jgi:glycosyltransferase involved in cell wall biosynthesis
MNGPEPARDPSSTAEDRPGPAILQVVTSDHRRGAESFAVDLGEALRRRGRAVETVALRPSHADNAFDLPILSPQGSTREAVTRLRRAARSAGVVVAHGSRTLPLSFAATVGTSTPFVYRVIGDPTYWVSTRLRRARVKFLLRRAAGVAVYYQRAADQLVRQYGIAPERLHVIAKGVHLDRYPVISPPERAAARRRFALADDAPVAVFVGSLSDEKDPALAVQLAIERSDLHLLVVGDGPRRVDLTATAASAGDRVTFLGHQADPRDAMAAADLLVLPSRTEGVPSVAIEAGLGGLPVIATDVGGNPEVVVDDRTGVLFSPGDTAGAVDALGRALAERERLGAEAARVCRERFDLERTAADWDALLQRVGRER